LFANAKPPVHCPGELSNTVCRQLRVIHVHLRMSTAVALSEVVPRMRYPLLKLSSTIRRSCVFVPATSSSQHVFTDWLLFTSYANTPEDRGGWAVVASGVGLVFILLFASLRLYTRYPFRSRLLYDDLAIIISTAAAIIQSSLAIAAVSQGLGKTSAIIEPRFEHPTEKVRVS
jgi:hypothetical protein